MPAPGPLEPWDAPPTAHGVKGGDLPGLTERLDELGELGINALYLNPVFTSASNHRYHTDDYFAVDPLLGGDAALRELLDAAHARGMHVILDGVFNHTGRGFRAVPPRARERRRVALSRLVPLRPGTPRRGPAPGSLSTRVPRWRRRASRANFERLGYEAWWGLPALPKLNHANPVVREHLMAGRRALDRASGPTAGAWTCRRRSPMPGFWQEFRRARQGRRRGGLHRGRDLGASVRSACRATSSTRS